MTSGRRFELRRELGSGSFGQVFLADMVSLGDFRKTVALKVLRPQLGGSSDAAKRLRDEARVLGRLRHRHIVAVDDLIRVDGRWAVVMEYVPGMDLEQLLKSLTPPEDAETPDAPQTAVTLGVANHAFASKEELDAATDELAAKIAANSRAAVAAMKDLYGVAQSGVGVEAGLEAEIGKTYPEITDTNERLAEF